MLHSKQKSKNTLLGAEKVNSNGGHFIAEALKKIENGDRHYIQGGDMMLNSNLPLHTFPSSAAHPSGRGRFRRR
jgi:hypothetical protein